MMEISELSKHKDSLEKEIGRLVFDELRMFTDTTGVDVLSVVLTPRYSYTLGSKYPSIYDIEIDVTLKI